MEPASMPTPPARPAISDIKSATELKRWYWLKSELVAFARTCGVPSDCNKPELLTRLGQWLDTGTVAVAKKARVSSAFDWGREPLTPDTVITDSYRNTQNMRRFMQTHAAAHFKFSNEFMAWMKASEGRTLRDAVAFWLELDAKKKQGYREKPLPQNQYNQFSRDLSAAVPGIAAAEIRRIWAIKRAGPGPHVYRSGDEKL
jgi:hypothetical protein